MNMFCSKCGKEIDDEAVVCVHCGCATKNTVTNQPNKSMLVAILLWFFFGMLGAHRFYAGDSQTGSVQFFLTIIGLLTCWFVIGFIPLIVVGIWVFIDLFLLISGEIKSQDGSKLV